MNNKQENILSGGINHILYKTVELQECILQEEHYPNVMHNLHNYLTTKLTLKASNNMTTTKHLNKEDHLTGTSLQLN